MVFDMQTAQMSEHHTQRRADDLTSSLIDIGILYHRTLGEKIARAYFEELNIPHAIVCRVMSAAKQRRRTLTDFWTAE